MPHNGHPPSQEEKWKATMYPFPNPGPFIKRGIKSSFGLITSEISEGAKLFSDIGSWFKGKSKGVIKPDIKKSEVYTGVHPTSMEMPSGEKKNIQITKELGRN